MFTAPLILGNKDLAIREKPLRIIFRGWGGGRQRINKIWRRGILEECFKGLWLRSGQKAFIQAAHGGELGRKR